ncbi:MAG: TonB-dependent receptor, partial [Desulfobacterales bacterium]|nr:TonB-dependent receptor [Desulfobacterales bacterium]
QGEFGKPPSTINDGSDPFAARPKYERVEDYDGISGQISAGYDTSGPLSLRSWFFVHQLDQEENRYDNAAYNSIARKGSYLKDNETQIFGGTIQSGYDLETAGRFTLALSAQKQELETSGVIRDVRLGGGNWGLRNFDEDQDLNTYSSALEYEVSPLNDLGLVLGYGHYWLDKNAGENDDHGSFLAGAHYDVCQSTRIKASVAGKIRFPSIRQLFDQTSGNTDLTTEKSYNFELGLEQTFAEHILVMLTGFLIDVEDYIEKYETTEIYENNEKYRFQGFELSAETQSIENIMLRAGYSFMDSEDRSRASAIDELEYRPEHKITFEGEYGFDCGVSAYVNVMRVKNQHYYSRNTPIIKSKLNDYTLVNVKIESSLLNDTMSIYVGVDNLFDEDYEESYAFPRAGRNAYAGVKIRF